MNTMHGRNNGPASSMIAWLVAGLFIFFGWAAFFEIDQAVRAQGVVIPSARTQVIQAVDGGVVSELLVHEGDRVVPGQRLAVLEKDRSRAGYEEARSRVASLRAALIRANAEITGQSPLFGKEFIDYPGHVQAQQALFVQRQKGLDESLSNLRDMLRLARDEMRMNEDLAATGDVSTVEVMRAKRQVSEIEGRMADVRNKYRQDVRQEITKLEDEIQSALYKLEDRQSVFEQTDLIARVAGIVKVLKVNTVGGVLRAGDELMQISPTDGEMIIEAKINPADIGDIALGLPASVRLDAFDYTIYGSVSGVLDYVSADTLTEQGPGGQTMSYYRALVRIDAAHMSANPKFQSIALKPGMTATVDLRTKTRTVFHYLTKPISRAFSGALRER